ncbi:MAG: carboxylating nicotinate-nucleotide diphosphorylase [Halorhodospira sp.]
MTAALPAREAIRADVARALEEDVGGGDLTAALVPASAAAEAEVIAREGAVLCGAAWLEEAFRQLDGTVEVRWLRADGDRVAPGTALCRVQGPARALLTGERTALNFLQLLAGTATEVRRFADAVAGTGVEILDTRKTVPGLRAAQRYAVRCGGGANHRGGLYDAYLIKENHIQACGGIARAVALARARADGTPVTVEVEGLEQMEAAIAGGADVVLLDNFDPAGVRAAVDQAAGRAALEVSGSVDLAGVRELAAAGVDRISVGALTKHVRALDLSMRFTRAA